jgi:hypothetical protein
MSSAQDYTRDCLRCMDSVPSAGIPHRRQSLAGGGQLMPA